MPEYLSPGVYIQEVDSGPRPIEGVGTAWRPSSAWRRRPGQRACPGHQLVAVRRNVWRTGGRRTTQSAPARRVPVARRVRLLPQRRRPLLRHPRRRRAANGKDGKVQRATSQLPSESSKAVAVADGQRRRVTRTRTSRSKSRRRPARRHPRAPSRSRSRWARVEENVRERQPRQARHQECRRDGQPDQQAGHGRRGRQAPARSPSACPRSGSYLIKAAARPRSSRKLQPGDFVGDVDRAQRHGRPARSPKTSPWSAAPISWRAYQAERASTTDGVKAVQLAMIAHCERMGDRMAILDPPPDLTPQEVKRWRESETNYDSKYAALYYPWIKVGGPGRQADGGPALGHMAGI